MLIAFYILTFMIEQILFKAFSFKTGFDISIIYITLFSISCGVLFAVGCRLFKEKTNKILTYVCVVFICLISGAQFIYYCIYSAPFSFYSLTEGGTGQALDFISTILDLMVKNIHFLFFFTPLILLILLSKLKLISFSKSSLSANIIYIYLSILIFVGTMALINVDNKEVDSSYDIYYNSNNLILQYNKFGFIMGSMLDLKTMLFYSPLRLEDSNLSNNTYIDSDLDLYNVFTVNLKNNEVKSTKDNIKEITKYIQQAVPTNKNDYTGKFKGKNLILVLGESFSDIVIDKALTPTLYKLKSEGYDFTNFYTPLFPVSTSDGEYMSLTGLIPASGTWSLKVSANKHLAFNTAVLAKNSGYNTYAYHNHDKAYFSRDKSMPNLGFETFKACPDLNIDCSVWPESDIDMIKATINDYIKEDKSAFLTYYITVSGHLPYTKNSSTVIKNWDLVKDLDSTISERTKQYLSSQIELDKALAILIKTLEKEGIAEDTVIALYPDHYPYGLTLDEINEISPYYKDGKFDIHKSPFLIWHKGIEPKKINTLCSNLDIMPTIANLFGFDYDSRMVIGKDIFSNSEKIVIFSDQSFITEKVKFDALKNTYINITEEKEDPEYVERIKKDVSNKFRISTAILTSDYYRSVFDER